MLEKVCELQRQKLFTDLENTTCLLPVKHFRNFYEDSITERQ